MGPALRMAGVLLCSVYIVAAATSANERNAILEVDRMPPAAGASLREAQALVRKEPLESRATSMLGTALLQRGDTAAAERAFSVARELGWRDRTTQIYWADRDLRRGDYRAAARSLDALLRQHPSLVDRQDLLGPFERDPAARAALARRMAEPSEWVWRYTLDWSGLTAPRMLVRVAMLEERASQNRPIGCTAAVGPVDGLVSVNAFALARSLWRRHCRDRSGGPLGDGSFIAANFEGKGGPFSWLFFSSGDVATRFEAIDARERRLVASNSGGTVLPLAAQMLIAAPGAYRLSWRSDGAAGALVAAVGCQPASGEWQSSLIDSRTGRRFVDLMVEASCPAPWLTLGISPSTGDVTLEGVVLAPRQ